MTRIEQRFEELRKRGEKGFIAYVTAGDPSLEGTRDIVYSLEDAGVDIVEMGIPFSDPLADGRVNQLAATRALEAGTTPRGVLDCVAAVRKRSDIPILCYSYLNPLCARGFERNVRAAAAAGLDGLLILDLPVEESAEYTAVLKKHGLNNVFLATPTTPPERVQRIVEVSTGFVYCVSREGVTGAQKKLNPAAQHLIRLVKKHTPLPVALGFGVADPRQAREAVRYADAVVVGSAIVQRYDQAPHTSAGRKQAARWVRSLVKAVKEG